LNKIVGGKRGKMAVKLKGWHIVALLLILFFLYYSGYIKFSVQPQPSVEQPPSENLVSVNKPIKFFVNDPLAGSAIGGASIYVYGSDKVLRESLTTDTDGTKTSALPYQSGTVIYVKIAKTGYVTRWVTVTVPMMSQADAQSLASNFVPLQTVNLGTYTIKATDQFGNSYSSGGTLNFTSLGVSTISVTFTIYNTEDNSGYVSSYDIINNVNLNAALLASTGGSSVTVQGAGASVVRGTTTYWITVLNDEGLTRQLVGNQYVKPGVTSVTITFGKGSLTKGSTQAFAFKLQGYFDQSYFAANGIGGPDAVDLASFSLTLAA
jgi:hypothetical protein